MNNQTDSTTSSIDTQELTRRDALAAAGSVGLPATLGPLTGAAERTTGAVGGLPGQRSPTDRGQAEWVQRAKLAPDDGDPEDAFGQLVALSGNGTTALLGAGNDEDPNGEWAGSAYVFAGGSTDDPTTTEATTTPTNETIADGDDEGGGGISVTQPGFGVGTAVTGTLATLGAWALKHRRSESHDDD